MIRPAVSLVFLSLLLFAFTCRAAENNNSPQTPLSQGGPQAKKYPRIVLYSVAWCPHCKAAKQYFTANNIPFINKDVELDDKAMKELTGKYKSQGVPIIIIGDDGKVLKGFDQEKFEKAVKELQEKK
jgi:glutaredoxin 3